MRNALQNNASLLLEGNWGRTEFFIERTIGSGASSIVYDAYCFERNGQRHNFRIKECFPHSEQVFRGESGIVWQSDQLREQAIERFCDAHYRLLQLQSNEAMGNNSVHVFDLCEGNNTLYSVMDVDFGHSYDQDNTKDIHTILKTVSALAKVVSRLHRSGFLHLDLKPSNFLVEYEPLLMLRLFDVDSLVRESEIKQRLVSIISYSNGWAAPEQVQGNFKSIGVCSDIYSLGAILFSKVMGRTPDFNDVGLFAKWEFEGELFEDVNPKIKRLLENIFRKTLAVSVKRRYGCVDDLVKDLEEAVNVTIDGKPFLVSNYVASTRSFIGREQELKEIRGAFAAGTRAVFLRGVGGIGKSELAKKYSERYRSEYDAILFCRYEGSLKKVIEHIEIQNFSGNEKEHLKCLRRLLDPHILLIIDNFDVATDADDYLGELLQLNAHVLFTTRTDFSQVLLSDTRQIEVKTLPRSTLERLFMTHCRKEVLTAEEYKTVQRIIELVDGLTYAVEILGRQVWTSGISLGELLRKTKAGLQSFEDAEKVDTTKDVQNRISRKDTALNLFRGLFTVAELSNKHKQVLRNVYLLQFLYMQKKDYRSMTCASAPEMDSLNELIELGWLREEQLVFSSTDRVTHYSLHAIVRDLVRIELTPTVENCCRVTDYIRSCIPNDSWFSGGIDCEAEEAEAIYKYEMLSRFSANLDLKQKANLGFVIDWMQTFLTRDDEDYIECEDLGYFFWSGDETTLQLFECLEVIAEQPYVVSFDRYRIYTILLKGWLAQFTIFYHDANKQEEYGQRREQNTEKYYNKAINEAHKMECEQVEEGVRFVCSIVVSLLKDYSHIILPNQVVQDAFLRSSEVFDTIGSWTKLRHGIPLSEEEQKIEDECHKETGVGKKNFETEEERFEKLRDKLSDGFYQAENKQVFIEENVLADGNLNAFQKAWIIEECIEGIFDSVWYGNKSRFESISLNQLAAILDEQEKLICLEEWDESAQADWSVSYSRDELYIHNEIHQSILLAKRNDQALFRVYMDSLFEETTEMIVRRGGIYKETRYATLYFRMAIESLKTIARASYAVEYLMRYAEFAYEQIALEDSHSDEIIYPIYRDIAEWAISASEEFNENDPQYEKYQQLAREYDKKANAVIGKDILFKPFT